MKLIKNLLLYVVYAMILYGSYYIGSHIETEGIFNHFKEPVKLEEIENDTVKDYIGRQAGEGIPVVNSALQFQDRTYSSTDVLTIEPVDIIGTGGYRLMNSRKSKRNYSYTSNGRRRKSEPLSEYTERPSLFFQFYYNQLYVVEFSDGTYMGVYMNDYYAKKFKNGKEVNFPIGKLKDTNQYEEQWLKAMGVPLDEKYVLDLIDNEGYIKIEKIDFLIRLVIGALSLVGLTGIFIGLQSIYDKKINKGSKD